MSCKDRKHRNHHHHAVGRGRDRIAAGSFAERIWPEIDVRARIERAAIHVHTTARRPCHPRGRST